MTEDEFEEWRKKQDPEILAMAEFLFWGSRTWDTKTGENPQ